MAGFQLIMYGRSWVFTEGEDGLLSIKCCGPFGGAGHDPAKVVRHALDEQLGFSSRHLGKDVLHDLFVCEFAHVNH